MSATVMTPTQAVAFGEYARDGVEGYEPANDNRTPFMVAAQAAEWGRMAERFAERGGNWAPMAYAAAAQAQRMRAEARRVPV
jgi:hypothetical protein